MNLLFVVLLPFLGSILPPVLARDGRRLPAAWAAGGVTVASLALLAPLVPKTFAGEVTVISWSWLPQLGLEAAFRLDGLSLLFALLILGIGLLIILYARYYLSAQDCMGRFYGYLLLFMGSMLGVVLAENLLFMIVFWELTSLSSFLLIGYWNHRADARQGARMALAITGGGGLALLAGVLLLGDIVGSYNLSTVLASGDLITAHPLYPVTLVLILLGVFTKSAQFPFHFWLPHAMSAPTPVSAYLHSATMVKAGVFLLARLYPALAGTELWSLLVGGAGLATVLFAAAMAFFKHDIKGLLAYSTVSHLGLITLLFGIGTPLAAVAGVFHIINHATFKASLFMAAGIVDHETGTRDMRRLGGLRRAMPHTALLAMVAAAAMAGVPLMNGFLSKEMFFEESLRAAPFGGLSWLMPVAATVAGVFSVAYSIRFIHDTFFGPLPADLPKPPHEPPRWMKIPVEVLVALCLLVGILPAITVVPILALAAGAVLGGELPVYSLSIWHGFTTAFVMSLLALGGGTAFYLVRRHIFAFYDRLPHIEGKRLFESGVAGLSALAARVTGMLENGSLQRYALFLIASAIVVGVAPFASGHGALFGDVAYSPVDPVSIVAMLALAAGAIGAAVFHRRRLVALVLVGTVGLVLALAFVKFSAPDLALTQLSVEVVTIVLLLLALYFLPQTGAADTSITQRVRDVTIASLAGLGAGGLTLAVLTRPYETIAGYFLDNSLPGGGGTNVVNVILVDFRGYDTLGEIAVIGIAAIGIYALLDGLQLKVPLKDESGQAWSSEHHPLILATITRPLLPLALLVSVFIFLRGHNLPGGGFIAGLITSVALIIQYLASGIAWTQARMRLDYHPVIAFGLLAALLTGLGSLFLDHPFLTSTFGHFHWPVVGEFELASAMAFDLGVYLAVVGSVLLALVKLGQVGVESRAAASGEAG